MKAASPVRVRLAALVCLAATVVGCAPEILPPSGAHPILPLEQVKIYETQPPKYELLGMIEVPVTPDMKWDERGDSIKGFAALRGKAAAMGANGVLLHLDAKQYEYKVGAGVDGTYYQVPMRHSPRTAVAAAIFVPQE